MMADHLEKEKQRIIRSQIELKTTGQNFRN